jgi:hypothetical protein
MTVVWEGGIMLLLISAAMAASIPVASPVVVSVAAIQPMVGGYRPVDVSDEGVQSAAAFAAGEMGTEVREIETAHRQTVAGVNYRIVMSTTNDERWQVTVYRNLQGGMQLTAREQLAVADIGPAEAQEPEEAE